jgi:hypothetical protein
MNKYDTRFGKVIHWIDFIKSKKNKSTHETFFDQSNTSLDGYSQRHIAIHLSHNNYVYVAVAIDNKAKADSNKNWWKFIVNSRIQNLINNNNNMSEDDKGVTVVPIKYLDLLYKDSFVYSNLYGRIDPTMLDMVIKQLMQEQDKNIDQEYSSYSKSKEVKK